MNSPCVFVSIFLSLLSLAASGTILPAAETDPSVGVSAQAAPEAEIQRKAASWAEALSLGDAAKTERVARLISTHLQAVRDWHNQHPYTTVPAGINPTTGKPLTQLEREVIADSAIPKSVHDELMQGLRGELTENRVEAVLDQYTVGKVAFTLRGYKAIVPDLKPEEEATITGYLKEAREQAIDFKNMKEISAIFEIYKTKSEQYLNANGRDWKALFKAYVSAEKAKKAARVNDSK